MKKQVAEIVASYLRNNSVSPSQVPALIASVSEALASLGKAAAPDAAVDRVPAVPVRRSIAPDKLTCLSCGFQGQMIKRHISSLHGMTPDQYREHWKLPADYPMVAKNYANRRSELAKSIGLGRRGASD